MTVTLSHPPPALGSAFAAHDWESVTIEARVLAGLIAESATSNGPTLRLVGARVVGRLDLSGIQVPRHLVFEDCWFVGLIDVMDAEIGRLELTSCRLLHGLKADRLRADTAIVSKCFIEGPVRLSGASLGRLELDGTRVVVPPTELAVDCNVLTTTRSVSLADHFCAFGRVRFIGASIGGQLSLRDSHFTSTGNRSALTLHEVTIGRSVHLRDMTVRGGLTFSSAVVGGNVNGNGVTLDAAGRPSRLALDLSGTVMRRALLLKEARVRGAVLAERLRVETLIELAKSRIEGLLSDKPKMSGVSLQMVGITCADIDLTGATLAGHVKVVDSDIAGSVTVEHVSFLPTSEAQDVDHDRDHARTSNVLIDLSGTVVARALHWQSLKASRAELDLSHLAVERLDDDRCSWAIWQKVRLNGFHYRSLPLESDEWSVDKRLKWLGSITADESTTAEQHSNFDRQLYDQLEALLREQGRLDDARTVAANRERRLVTGSKPSLRRPFSYVTRPLRWLVHQVSGYGYHPERALWWLAAIILVGAAMYECAFDDDAVSPSIRCPSDAPCFNALLLSADVALPIIDLGYEDAWHVHGSEDAHWLYEYGAAAQIAFGWTLATLAVAGFARRAIRD
jgi:hypothetical protein